MAITNPSILQRMLKDNQWGPFQSVMDRLACWPHWSVFLHCLSELNRDALYKSPVHGVGHIERVLLHGAICAMDANLNKYDTQLLLEACSYHDVGRVNDWQDVEHGHRSARQIAALTGRGGEELTLLMAIVDAHSRPDKVLEKTIQSYHPGDFDKTLLFAQLLKDSDGLDRVRIHDLNTAYLRRPTSAQYADFALYLFGRYQMYYALERPFANERALGMQLDARNQKEPSRGQDRIDTGSD